ncbi:MAG: hypothetical protein GKR89_05905 [Candidatus Latescibacteria bacterium]|nr:hypothetical protein [Candidatus Latescibacterota bacterium]
MSQVEEGVLVVGLCGSLSEGSYTRRVVELALEGAQQTGARTQLIDLREYNLPFCDGRDEEGEYPADVFRLQRDVAQARGVILGTPEYHGSFSGVLKNALDLMGFDQWEGKMVGLVGVSGGRMGANNALNGLRDICRALHAWVIPEQASVPQAWKEFDDDGAMTDEELAERVRAVGKQVAHFTCLHQLEGKLEFIRQWQSAPANPGGGKAE